MVYNQVTGFFYIVKLLFKKKLSFAPFVAGETGIPNVNVELMSLTNVSLAVTKTNSAGNYYFSSLNTSAVAVGVRYFIRIDIMQPALTGSG